MAGHVGDVGGGRIGTQREILHVPVSVCAESILTIRTGRLQSSGERVGLGFTSRASLAVVFGSKQASVLLHLQSLHKMLAPRGITEVRVDPRVWQPARTAGKSDSAARARIAATRPRFCGPQAETGPVAARTDVRCDVAAI